jgi:hypothetical protein
MSFVPSRVQRTLPVTAGAVTLLSVTLLLLCDGFPRLFPPKAHDILVTLPLVLIAFAYLLFQAVRRARLIEWVKALIVALAFLFWAANQIWVERTPATLFNDIAIGLFVVDVFLVIIGWPSDAAREATPGGPSVSSPAGYGRAWGRAAPCASAKAITRP